jgi:photosystem II stability/assembly factor-like uncharacterized protein
MRAHASVPALGAIVVASIALLAPARAAELDPGFFSGLQARAIGPAVMGGRIAAMDAVRRNTLHIFVGAASGGVWRSRDGGMTFAPVFDEHIQSIGAIRIDPSDPDTVWVGTGEGWVRNSVSIGNGVYKSTDGGDSWKRMGLEDSERITRIVVDPKDGDTVWVCATGHLWNANEQRGVYKTTDGGATWERVLYVDADTGCSDLAVDEQNPKVLFAGMWQYRRTPWSFTSGGPGSGLYRSTDGGATWTELTEGLPRGEKGRVAVAVAPSRSSRVYALVEAEKTALYRSDDLGVTWEQTNSSFSVSARPFYFAYVVVDPADFERVYKPGLFLAISTDGGRSFFNGGAMHADLHAVWIDPDDPYEMLVGTDGGLYHSYDRGATFRHAQALPIAQYYEVGTDLAWPYNVYGGLQDNGTWVAPSRASGGIFNHQWRNIGYGDGFHAYPDPADPDFVFVEYQGGQVLRYRTSTGEIKQIKPYPGAADPDHRCNWNAAMHVGGDGALYAGCQFLFRSTDGGESWTRISPDLTTDDPEKQLQASSGGLTVDNTTAENHTTIVAIADSPLDRKLLWVGTDDGNLQVTRDGGETWNNVVANVPDLPPWTWVSFVEPSPHDAATAFATFDGHRLGDMATYVYRTTDFGATWSSLVPPRAATADGADQPALDPDKDPGAPGITGFAHVVRQDPVNPDLLFVGTELGLFLSIDGGGGWTRFEGNLPPVPVHDLDIHPRDHDLVIGTHGRGVYVLDDLTPLRALRADALEQELVVLPSRASVQFLAAQTQSFPGADEWVGQTLPEVASLFYYQARRHIFGDMRIAIYDPEGELVAEVPAGKRRGINRVDWAMRRPAPKIPPAASLAPAITGPRVPEGRYTFEIAKGSKTYAGAFELVADPRGGYSREDRALQQRLANDLYDALEELTYVIDATVHLRDAARSAGAGASGRVASRLAAYADELEAFRASLVATAEGGPFTGEEKLRERLAEVFGAIAGFDGPPTRSQSERAAVLGDQVREALERYRGLSSEARLAELNRSLETPLEPLSRESWREQQEGSGSRGGFSAELFEGLAQGAWRPFATR